RKRWTPVPLRPKKPYFVTPLRVFEHVLPVRFAVDVLPFESVDVAVAGAQLIVIVPSSASPSLSVNVFAVADDQFVLSEILKWPFGWSLPPTIDPVAVADALPKLVPVPESFANSPLWSKSPLRIVKNAPSVPLWWWLPSQASTAVGAASAQAATNGSRSLFIGTSVFRFSSNRKGVSRVPPALL